MTLATRAAPRQDRPALPAVPQPPATPRVTATVPGPGGTSARVYTPADIAALRARKSELYNQIRSANDRRKEVQGELRGAIGADKTGLEQRLGVLDTRIARLEQDIDENSGQLASLEVQRAITGVAGTRWSPAGAHWGPDTGNSIEGNATPLLIVFMIFVMAPLSVATARALWKRASRPPADGPHPDTTQRLERMEQAMDAIAIEVERVSEGQRFVTRLLSESRGALGAGQPAMEPLRVGEERIAERR